MTLLALCLTSLRVAFVGEEEKSRFPHRIADVHTAAKTGAVKTLTCTACMGKGVLPITANETQKCPTCHGSGDDPSASAMYCLQCRGRGYIHS